jgi:hypothetical protein
LGFSDIFSLDIYTYELPTKKGSKAMFNFVFVIRSNFSVSEGDLDAIKALMNRVDECKAIFNICSIDPQGRHEARIVIGPTENPVSKDRQRGIKDAVKRTFGILGYSIRVVRTAIVEGDKET